MIDELKDNEILDFLMTSEFDGDYSPSELKYLLIKWRYFYRVLDGNLNRDSVESQGLARKLNSEIDGLKDQITKLMIDVANRDNTIMSMKTRKLTLIERFSGKIILKDEDK
jgi:hypothetical protein